MDVSFQLYSARKAGSWNDVFRTLAALGYTRVEGFGGVYADPAGLRSALDGHGLAMSSGHFALDMLEDDLPKTLELAAALGIGHIYCPHLAAGDRPADAAGWAAFGRRLAAVGDAVAGAGMTFGWHNHDFEFMPLVDGIVPMQTILEAAPGIGWECDVAWIVRGGADPFDWIARFGDRITAVHVKDIAPAGECADEDGWADVGHGTMDWRGLMVALHDRTPADLFVMEHDMPSDFERFARRSMATFRQF